MSTLSISPFSASPLHAFRLPKSSSGRSNCGSDADWSSAFASSNSFTIHDEQQHDEHDQQQQAQQQQHHTHQQHYSIQHSFTTAAVQSDQSSDSLPRSTSFPHLATSPTLFSPLDAQSSSPSLISPKLFSPLDSLSPPRLFASSSRLLDLVSPSHLSPSPLFAGGLSVSPHHGSHHSSLTASLSARQHPDPFTNGESSSSSSSCPTDSFVPSAAATASSASSTASRGHFQHDGDVDMTPAGAPAAAASSSARLLSSIHHRPATSSALSDMSNDHYLSFEVLNIDAMTGHIKTEETAFSPANAAVFDFVSLQQPLQDALTSTNGMSSSSASAVPLPASMSASSQQRDYPYPALNFDDADAELLSRASSPSSQLEAEDALDRIASPPDTSFFSSHAHSHVHTGQHNLSSMQSPFTLPPTSAHPTRSSSSRASKRSLSSHSQSQSTPSTPLYSSAASHPSLQLQTDLTLLQSSVSHMDYQQRVKFVESFKALADKGEAVQPLATGDNESSGMDANVLNMIFSPADAAAAEGFEHGYEEEEVQSEVDEDEEMEEDGQEVPLDRAYTGERLTGRRRKRLQVPLSPCRRFSVPALRTTHPSGSHMPGHPFPPLSPSLSVSSHNSSGSSPLPRSLASGSDEDSLHANSPHPRMATSVMPASVMALQITPVQAMRVGVAASSPSNGNNVTTATAVVEEVMNALPVSPSAVVTAEAVATASPLMPSTSGSSSATPAAAMAVAVPAATVKAKPSKVAVSSAVVLDGVVPAAVVPASPVQSSAAVPATITASAASPVHRARVLPSVPPRPAFAFPQSKKMKTGKALPAQQLYSSPVAACIPASPVAATMAYAQPLQATAIAASPVMEVKELERDEVISRALSVMVLLDLGLCFVLCPSVGFSVYLLAGLCSHACNGSRDALLRLVY